MTGFICGVLIVPLLVGVIALLHVARWADDP